MNKTLIIASESGSGKTDKCIRLSAKTGAYIVCPVTEDVRHIWDKAKEMRLSIPYPMTFYEWVESRFYGCGVKGFIFDDIDRMVTMHSGGVPLVGVSLLTDQEDLDASGVD